jgi:nucleoside-diphosphate-sugar epimerase
MDLRMLSVLIGSTAFALASEPPLRLLVLGGNGFLGLEFVEAAAARFPEATLTLVHRGNSYWGSVSVLKKLKVTEVVCSRSDIARCAAISNKEFDWVVDFSAQNGSDVKQSMISVNVKGYLHISSEAVYGPVVPFVRAPLKEYAYVKPHKMNWISDKIMRTDPYLVAKIEQEEVLFQYSTWKQMCATALRLPFVIGRRDSTHRLAQLLLLLEAGDITLSAASRVPISFVDARSVASAALHVIAGGQSERVCGKAFNVAQPPMSLETLLRSAAEPGSTPLKNRTKSALLPMTTAQGIFPPIVYSQLLPFTLSGARFEKLGWRPPLPLAAAVAEAAQYTREHLFQSKETHPAERAGLADKASLLLAKDSSLGGLPSVMRRYGLESGGAPPAKQLGISTILQILAGLAAATYLLVKLMKWSRASSDATRKRKAAGHRD